MATYPVAYWNYCSIQTLKAWVSSPPYDGVMSLDQPTRKLPVHLTPWSPLVHNRWLECPAQSASPWETRPYNRIKAMYLCSGERQAVDGWLTGPLIEVRFPESVAEKDHGAFDMKTPSAKSMDSHRERRRGQSWLLVHATHCSQSHPQNLKIWVQCQGKNRRSRLTWFDGVNGVKSGSNRYRNRNKRHQSQVSLSSWSVLCWALYTHSSSSSSQADSNNPQLHWLQNHLVMRFLLSTWTWVSVWWVVLCDVSWWNNCAPTLHSPLSTGPPTTVT